MNTSLKDRLRPFSTNAPARCALLGLAIALGGSSAKAEEAERPRVMYVHGPRARTAPLPPQACPFGTFIQEITMWQSNIPGCPAGGWSTEYSCAPSSKATEHGSTRRWFYHCDRIDEPVVPAEPSPIIDYRLAPPTMQVKGRLNTIPALASIGGELYYFARAGSEIAAGATASSGLGRTSSTGAGVVIRPFREHAIQHPNPGYTPRWESSVSTRTLPLYRDVPGDPIPGDWFEASFAVVQRPTSRSLDGGQYLAFGAGWDGLFSQDSAQRVAACARSRLEQSHSAQADSIFARCEALHIPRHDLRIDLNAMVNPRRPEGSLKLQVISRHDLGDSTTFNLVAVGNYGFGWNNDATGGATQLVEDDYVGGGGRIEQSLTDWAGVGAELIGVTPGWVRWAVGSSFFLPNSMVLTVGATGAHTDERDIAPVVIVSWMQTDESVRRPYQRIVDASQHNEWYEACDDSELDRAHRVPSCIALWEEQSVGKRGLQPAPKHAAGYLATACRLLNEDLRLEQAFQQARRTGGKLPSERGHAWPERILGACGSQGKVLGR